MLEVSEGKGQRFGVMRGARVLSMLSHVGYKLHKVKELHIPGFTAHDVAPIDLSPPFEGGWPLATGLLTRVEGPLSWPCYA